MHTYKTLNERRSTRNPFITNLPGRSLRRKLKSVLRSMSDANQQASTLLLKRLGEESVYSNSMDSIQNTSRGRITEAEEWVRRVDTELKQKLSDLPKVKSTLDVLLEVQTANDTAPSGLTLIDTLSTFLGKDPDYSEIPARTQKVLERKSNLLKSLAELSTQFDDTIQKCSRMQEAFNSDDGLDVAVDSVYEGQRPQE